MEDKSIIKKRTYEFALKIIDLYKILISKNEYVLSKQPLKAGTSIGANVEEALAGQSRADFLSKMSIASKETRETNHWLRLIRDSKFLEEHHTKPLIAESSEIIRMLTSIVKTTVSSNSKLKTKNS
ncbi:MAG: four helix bundle protein [Proteobacteria bacterium]|nr:four helix bundle protein [Pseudomonadota bacterium]